MRTATPEEGFTLVELVVGSVVLSGVLLAAYVALEAGLRSEDLLEWRRDASQGARAALALLSADLRSATRLSEEIDLIGMDRDLGGIEADNIDFGTRNWRPEGPGESDFAEASWFVSRDPETDQIGLWRRRDPTPDLEPLAGGMTEEVLAPIAGFRLEYFDGFTWEDSWGAEADLLGPAGGAAPREPAAAAPGLLAASSGLPSAVRITLALAPPRRGEAAGRPPRREEAEPGGPAPLVFRTTVHLNLAASTSHASDRGALSAARAPAAAGAQAAEGR